VKREGRKEGMKEGRKKGGFERMDGGKRGGRRGGRRGEKEEGENGEGNMCRGEKKRRAEASLERGAGLSYAVD
jgi:hypothetical protein